MVEGSGPEQMSPELENKAFSAKSTQYMALKRHKESYNTSLRLTNEVCSSYRVNRQTDRQTDRQTHRTTTVTLRRMRRGLKTDAENCNTYLRLQTDSDRFAFRFCGECGQNWNITVSFIIYVNFDHAWAKNYPITLSDVQAKQSTQAKSGAPSYTDRWNRPQSRHYVYVLVSTSRKLGGQVKFSEVHGEFTAKREISV